MPYELAKQLKDAGFYIETNKQRSHWEDQYGHQSLSAPSEGYCYFPTLEELIRGV